MLQIVGVTLHCPPLTNLLPCDAVYRQIFLTICCIFLIPDVVVEFRLYLLCITVTRKTLYTEI